MYSFLASLSFGQTVLKGNVIDEQTNQPMAGVNVSIENKLVGTVTDIKGNFTLTTKFDLPFNLLFSFVGYEKQIVPVNENSGEITVILKEQILLGQEVVVSASRVEESIMRSPVSIEKMNLIEIQQSPAPNFFDGLYNLKGVDMSVHGLLFKLPNTRGFNGNTNYRMNQMIDGMDNTPPGLSYAAGNIFGLSQLDVESVELLVGASSALYGPGGMNGTLLMTSKNPFDYPGLSASIQLGVMHAGADYRGMPAPFGDFNLRYAKKLNPKWAFKLVGEYIRAEDWHGADYRDRTDVSNKNLNRNSNPGYDGVNVYGDDIIVPVNLKDLAPQVADGVATSQGFAPGTPEYEALYNQVIALMPDQFVSRTGWKEEDLVDYNTKNLKVGGSLHHRIHENLEAIFQGAFSSGTSVYTAQNRFSLRNFNIYSGKLELKSSDFYLRTYTMVESSGDTYDAGATGLLMNEAWKPSEDWYQDYITGFTQTRLLGGSEQSAHQFARLLADNRDELGNVFNPGQPYMPFPRTNEFKSYFNDITGKPVNEGGSKVVDKSKLWHIEGLYNFQHHIKFVEWLIGASHRIYSINSEGTIFFDTPGNPIIMNQFGAFTQLSRKVLRERVKVTGSARYDKNEFFKGQITPRLSFVYTLNEEGDHNVRGSYQTAFRFPAIADQWVNLNTGRYQVVGGLPQVQNAVDFDTNPVYPLSGPNPIVDKPVTDNGPFIIPAFGPEKVRAIELGYKGLLFHNLLLIDAYVYQNVYTGFMAQQTLAQNPNTPQEKRYETTISTDFPVTAYGWAFGADLILNRGYLVRSNVNYNTLETDLSNRPGLQSGFNTPDYRFNISLSNREVYKNIGFSINWRWQNKFLWESSFGVAEIPAYSSIDASLNIKLEKLKSTLKIGGSNVLNRYYTTNFGSGQIGGLYYISLAFDERFR